MDEHSTALHHGVVDHELVVKVGFLAVDRLWVEFNLTRLGVKFRRPISDISTHNYMDKHECTCSILTIHVLCIGKFLHTNELRVCCLHSIICTETTVIAARDRITKD